ncbi:YggS family pyridoxal phosphate-dependent enzyme [Hazenella sp. IB182353]|uniref:YggS family pyridoxal phosphate-dependent enzyme n=1 Tax=Polycladospora coralii TaxID=2771432 RepID=UPI00174673A1|nr:YggS family pyridoxal phosphate-dependent enzyme [Polycladospora coralii]MBS7532006.1 YggS family pyridoxal phosphate-dependent enzyme [Polycladospora coralii]
MDLESDIRMNLQNIQERIQRACLQVGRDPAEIRLLLATKTVPLSKIDIAIQEGYALLGENKVQEALAKFGSRLDDAHIERHFIGHVQTNKVNQVLRFATCIQSVDRLKLAQKLDNRLRNEGRTLDVYVQVNTSQEESKFGITPDRALSLMEAINGMEGLNLKGLMTIGLFSRDADKVRACFQTLRMLKDEAVYAHLLDEENYVLSMGMSHDLEIAIEEGANLIRVGTAIFGKRKYDDTYYWNENLDVQ